MPQIKIGGIQSSSLTKEGGTFLHYDTSLHILTVLDSMQKRIKFNYEDKKHRDNCGPGEHYICYLEAEIDWSA